MNNIIEKQILSKKYENIWTLMRADNIATIKHLSESIKNKDASRLMNRESIVTLGSLCLLTMGMFTGLALNWYELLLGGIALPVLGYLCMEALIVDFSCL